MELAEQAARTARRVYEPVEGVHVAVYAAPETAQAYAALGLPAGYAGYVASRSGVLGEVVPEAVAAVFYVFAPRLVSACLPAAWTVTSPAAVLAARQRALDTGLRRVLEPHVEPAALQEAADLLAAACDGLDTAGRPLAAGQAAQPVPPAPHLAVWHWCTVLREHRGDGHLAALLGAGLDPVETLVLHAAVGGPQEFLQQRRGWTPEEWVAGVERLQARGLVEADGRATVAGQALRREVERATDRSAAAPWRRLGSEPTERLRALLLPVATAVREADTTSGSTRRIGLPRGTTWPGEQASS